MPRSASMLDTVITAETPEGMLLELRPAGLTARFHAFLIDWMIRIGAIYLVAMASAFGGGIGLAFWLIFLFVLEWLYPVVFELGPRGATPGKRALGLKVVMENGLPVTPAASIARNILRAADFLPFAYGAAIVSMLLRDDCRRLGDLAAGTLVVFETRADAASPMSEVTPVAPVTPLSLNEQAALMALAARAPRLTTERLDELAALAASVSGDAGHSGPAVTTRVLGVAQWVLGRRR
ncbi:MAG: RDD family protein [Vicinamibacterales bacterium]